LKKPDYFAGRRIGRRIAIRSHGISEAATSHKTRHRRARLASLAAILVFIAGSIGATVGLQSTAHAFNSFADWGTWTVSTNTAALAEGNSGTAPVEFTLTTTTALKNPCGMAINFGGSATAGVDYDITLPPAGSDPAAALTAVKYYAFSPTGYYLRFPSGTAAGYTFKIAVNVKGDTTQELDEAISMIISSQILGDASALGCSYDTVDFPAKFTATTTITDDDKPPAASRGIWSLTAPAPTLEGNTGTNPSAAFVLKTTETLTEPCGIAFNLTLGATGIIGSDYAFPLPPAGATPAAIGTTGDLAKVTYYASSATGFYLRFPKGTAAGSTFAIPINITGDPYYEADETVPALITSFNLVDGLGTLGCGYDAVGPFVATATIKNDDPIPSADAGIFALTGPAPTVEGDVGNTTAAFTLTTSKATTVNCGVAINVWNVTAAAGVDYDLSIPPAGSTPGAFFVPGDPTKLTYYPFNSIGYWLRIPANTPAGAKFTIPVDIKGDLLKEADETFNASFTTYALNDGLGTVGCGYDPLAPATWSASATITDDDTISAGTWAITGPAPTIEGNTGNTPAVFTLSTSKDVTINCGIAINVVNGTAIAGFDYDLLTPPAGATPAALFTPGDPTQVTYYAYSATGYFLRFPKGTPAGYTFSIPVNVKGDVYFEADETFSTTITSYALAGDTLGTVGCGYDPLAPATFTAKATIVNDDAAPVFNLTGPDSIVEGNTGTTPATYKITSATGTTTAAPCQVLFTALNETAIWPLDWKVAGESTNFFKVITIDGLSATGVIDIVGDTLFEADETYTVNIVGTGANPCPVDLTKRIVTTKILNDETTLASSQLTFPAPGASQPGISITGGTGTGTGATAAAAPAASSAPSTTAALAVGSGSASSGGSGSASTASNVGGSSGNSTTTTTAAPAIIPAANIAPAPAAQPAVGKTKVLGEVASVAYTGASSTAMALLALACIALGFALLRTQRRSTVRRP
jgi:hypothetical protein